MNCSKVIVLKIMGIDGMKWEHKFSRTWPSIEPVKKYKCNSRKTVDGKEAVHYKKFVLHLCFR
jgi:hypothetical protein